MPARRNRPDKYRGHGQAPKPPHKSKLIEALIIAERDRPGAEHYVGWPDMEEARRLQREGYLASYFAIGCFSLTKKFRGTFGAP